MDSKAILAAAALFLLHGCATKHDAPPQVVEPHFFKENIQRFSAQRYALAQDISKTLNLPIPQEARDFFEAAISGDEAEIETRTRALFTGDEIKTHNTIPGLANELWAPVQEVFGLHGGFYNDWKNDAALLKMFYEPILNVMPSGSIYFGGSESGRFLITMMNELEGADVFCLTQNGLADQRYPAYLRFAFGDKIWIPSTEDLSLAFREFVEDVQAGRRPNNGSITYLNGHVQVSGAYAVMEINSIIIKTIFDRNKDNHDFYIEESYPIAWMYPHLRPCGNIMKLEKEPLPTPRENPQLWNEIAGQDKAHWDPLEKALFAHNGFTDNLGAQMAFAQLRSAIGGVYLWHGMTEEADGAFKQSVRMAPKLITEGGINVAILHMNARDYAKAREVLREFLTHDEHQEAARRLLARIDEKEEADAARNAILQGDAEQGAP